METQIICIFISILRLSMHSIQLIIKVNLLLYSDYIQIVVVLMDVDVMMVDMDMTKSFQHFSHEFITSKIKQIGDNNEFDSSCLRRV